MNGTIFSSEIEVAWRRTLTKKSLFSRHLFLAIAFNLMNILNILNLYKCYHSDLVS